VRRNTPGTGRRVSVGFERAAYVESHPDEDWGEQVNALVDAQLQSARHFEDERPEPETLRESPLLEE
jgi:hypothetical protein